MKTKTNAKLLLHSKVKTGEEITTWELTFHRFILSEFNTHRVFSRNAASSRAIPTLKILKRVLMDPAIPVEWGANNPGMQSKSLLTGWRNLAARTIWRGASFAAVAFAYLMYKAGVHKQIVNRIVEPWVWVTVLMTTTDLKNFFDLRAHPDAQPEIQVLARDMIREYLNSTPYSLEENEWHAPYTYISSSDEKSEVEEKLLQSVARCARVSYLNHDGKETTLEQDVNLAKKLISMRPIHASPAEHQVKYDPINPDPGNLRGPFVQFRKIIEKTVYSLDER